MKIKFFDIVTKKDTQYRTAIPISNSRQNYNCEVSTF